MKTPGRQSCATRTVEDARYEFSTKEIVRGLRAIGLLPEAMDSGVYVKTLTTEKVTAFVRVPGGGDWSNTNLEVGTDCPLVVTVKRESNT